MIKRIAPKHVWDFGMVYKYEILSRTSRGHDGRTGMERITGDTVDISEWTDFEFYDLCWYWDTPVAHCATRALETLDNQFAIECSSTLRS